MAEESENSGGSLKSILIGLVSTVTIAVGGFVTKQLTGEEDKAEPAAAVTAPAPVINITTNNTQQQKQAASAGGGTKIIERVVEKPSAPKKKSEKEALKEDPQW
jgi:CheY-like chemotaxis protein